MLIESLMPEWLIESSRCDGSRTSCLPYGDIDLSSPPFSWIPNSAVLIPAPSDSYSRPVIFFLIFSFVPYRLMKYYVKVLGYDLTTYHWQSVSFIRERALQSSDSRSNSSSRPFLWSLTPVHTVSSQTYRVADFISIAFHFFAKRAFLHDVRTMMI